ncbi:putative ribonuclease H-like domain-containing protein [Tanacetum coccineum]
MSTIVLRYISSFSEPYNQEVVFLVLSRLSPLNENTLSSVKNLQTVFRECLARDSITVTLRSSVISTLVNFMPYLLDRQDFTDLVPYMVQAFSKAVELHEEREAQRTLSLLIELVITAPHCFQSHLGSVVEFMLNIGRSATPMYQRKLLCFMFLRTLVKEVITGSAPDMLPLVVNAGIIEEIMGTLFEMLTEIQLEGDYVNVTDEDEDGVWKYTTGESDKLQQHAAIVSITVLGRQVYL